MHHGRSADEGRETGGRIGRATGHLVALGVPGFHQIGLGGRQHPVLSALEQVLGGDNLVDQARALGVPGRGELAFQKEGGRHHRAQLARQPRGAARAGEDADHDLGQADLGLRVVGGDDAVTGEREFQPDPQRGSRQGRDDGLAAFQGLRVHPGAFDLAQDMVHLHHAVKDRLRAARPHLGDDVQVHAASEILLAAGDDDALDGSIRQRRVDQAVQRGEGLGRHDVHGFGLNVPDDAGDAVCIGGHGEIGHLKAPRAAMGRLQVVSAELANANHWWCCGSWLPSRRHRSW
jgi:hypothetical protein